MKTLEEIINDCNIPYPDIKKKHFDEYNRVAEQEKSWLNNAEEKTVRIVHTARPLIDLVITKLKVRGYEFTPDDTEALSAFTSKINLIIRITNRINNFKEGVILDNGKKLRLYELFNAIKKHDKFGDFKFELNRNLNSFTVHLFSIVKHCQDPQSYPIYYRYWKNILGNVLKKSDDYDTLCQFYKTISDPKRHLSLGAYFGAIGIILAREISVNKIIKEEDDKQFTYIKNELLNIHYFDLITGFKRHQRHYLVGSKYGEKNDKDVFPQMKDRNVIAVGFADNLDLSEFYLGDVHELSDYLRQENVKPNAINALKHFLKIKVGDKIAIKGSGSPKGTNGFLSIMAIGEVVARENGQVYNFNPDHLVHELSVRFTDTEYRELNYGGYGSTVHLLTNKEHISSIFKEHNNFRTAYLEWLTNKNVGDSGKPTSYTRAIEILSTILKYNLFEETNLVKLQELYNDLRIEQGKIDGKYYYDKSPSYGTSGFYSASIGEYINFLKTNPSPPFVSDPSQLAKVRVENRLSQAICITGASGVGKTYRVNKTLEQEGHKMLFVIIDSMWQHILFDYSPNDRTYRLTKVGKFIREASNDPENHYTIVFDECHKNLEIINDVLLQAISTKRNNGMRFLALNTLVDKQFEFLAEINGNRILPSNLGFMFISSKSDIITGNDDLRNRIEIIELEESDQLESDTSIDYFLRKIKKEEDSEYTN
ncbi:MAG: hypothetical protein EOO51_01445 [Flavobacterium sp.]|nr:MAG: hypothetical protein EOO51_01445 [Flavobacterium sp.]